MDINNKQIYSFQVASYLMKEYGYEVLRIRNEQRAEEEIWLLSESQVFPLIRITPYSALSDRYEIERLTNTKYSVSHALDINIPKLLCIHISEEEPTQYHEAIEEYCMEKGYQSSHELDDIFPKLKTLLKDIKNPLAEYRKVLKEIHETNKVTRERNKPKLKDLPWTYSIIILCTAIFVLALLAGKKFNDNVLGGILLGSYYKTLILGNHEYWRLLTHGFVHTEFFHIFMNLYALYSIGPTLEKIYGKKKFLITLLVSIVSGGLFILAGSHNEVSLGLSGGIYGLFALLVIYAFESGAIKNQRVLRTFGTVLVINVIISFLPSVSLLGHLGGFVAGLFCGIIFSTKDEWKTLRGNCRIASVLLLVLVAVIVIRDPKYGTMYVGTDLQYVNALRELDLRWFANLTEKNLMKYYQIVGGMR